MDSRMRFSQLSQVNRFRTALAACILCIASVAPADTPLKFNNARLRATPPGATLTAGYITIDNANAVDDRLLGGSAPFAERVEIHETVVQDDVARMVPLEDGLVIQAGNTTTLSPGGLHLMFIGVEQPLKPEERHAVMLEFERSGSMEVSFTVQGRDAMQHSPMHHDKADAGKHK